MTRLTRFALDQPALTVLLALFVLIAGAVAAVDINRELIPDIEFPQATVLTIWPGASAGEITRSVVEPIEKALEDIEDVDVVEVSSRASEGFSAVTVRAEFGTSQDDLRDAIDTELADVVLPDGAEDPELLLFSFGDIPVVQLSISGPLDEVTLLRLVEDEVVPELETIEGVSRVEIAGGQEEKIFVTLDPERLADEGLTIGAISNLLAANNLSFPVGTLVTDGKSIPLQVVHRVDSVDAVGNLVVAGSGGQAGPPANGPPSRTEDRGGSQAADEAMAATPVEGPFPLPAVLTTLFPEFQTTDDLTPELVQQLEEDDPELLRDVADEIFAGLPPGSLGALPPDVVEALPEDLRADLIARVGPGAAADAAEAQRRVRIVAAQDGDTVADLAERFGAEADEIRALNGLAEDEEPEPGAVLRVPVPDLGTALTATWGALGATDASEITPEIMREALLIKPSAVSDLTAEQLLALPAATVRTLPLSFISRQPESVRSTLMELFEQEAALPTGGRLLGPWPQAADDTVRLSDVASDISLAPEAADSVNRTNRNTSLSVLVYKERSANTVQVSEDVLERTDELVDDVSALDDVEFNTVFEQGSFVTDSLNGVITEGTIGGIMAVLIILVFLNFSVRSTLITALSIPLSILAGLILMRGQGLTLNLLTLSGLTISVGRVVDDAIVVLENIYRHIQRGDDLKSSVLEGTREVSSAITAATLIAVAVFLPLGFIGGLTREFFLPMALTVTYALMASLVVALTIVPLLSRGLLSRDRLPEERETWLQRLYTPSLEWALDHRLITLFLALLFFLATLPLATTIKQTFLPGFGEPSITVELEMPPGTALERTNEVALLVEDVLIDGDLEAGDSEETIAEAIGTVEATVGSGGQDFGILSGGDTSRAFFFATLDDESEAELDDVADAVRDALVALTGVEEAKFTVRGGEQGGPQGNLFDLQILGDDEDALRRANEIFIAALSRPEDWEDEGFEDGIPLVNLESNLAQQRDVLAIEVDPVAAIERGLTTAQVAFAVRQVVEGQSLGEIEIADRNGKATVVDVFARYPADTVDSEATLRSYEISSPNGPVPLSEVAEVTQKPGPVLITRIDGRRAALITADISDEDTFGVTAAAENILDGLEDDIEDLAGDVEWGRGVESQSQQDGFRDLLLALPVSIIIGYIIMVVTFNSLLYPFVILFGLPFAVTGGLIALAVTGTTLSISSLIGFLLLIGIVLTNAIVLVDLVQQYRERGMDRRTALVRAGRTRLRPIIMTALATAIALVPLALGFTEGAIIAEELAITVIGGLLVSTLLTLIIVPVMYSLLDGAMDRVRGGDGGGAPASPPAPEPPPVPPANEPTDQMFMPPTDDPPAVPA